MTPKQMASVSRAHRGRSRAPRGAAFGHEESKYMPAVTRAIAAFGIATACILHFTVDAHAAPKRPKTNVPSRGSGRSPEGSKRPKKGAEPKKVEKAEPETVPAAAEPAPEPSAPPLPATSSAPATGGSTTSSDAKPEAPPKKDESSAASSTSAAASSTSASAAKDKPALVPVPKSKTLEPLHVDVKATGNADALLAFIGVGAAADVGVVRAGPGVIALGGAGEYDFCATVCWLFNA